jgi:hypothetical protein
MKLYSVYLFIYAYDSEIIHTTYDITIIQYIKNVITAYITALQCLRTLVPPKGRGGMSLGRLKYIIKKVYFGGLHSGYSHSINPNLPRL